MSDNESMTGTKKNGNAESDQPNWYENGFEDRKATIREAGEIKNNVFEEYLKLAKKYDQLKKNIYNLTDTAVDEGVISQEDGRYYISEIKHVDKDVQSKTTHIRNSVNDYKNRGGRAYHGGRGGRAYHGGRGGRGQPFYKK